MLGLGPREEAHKKTRPLGLPPIVLAIGVAIWLKWPGLMLAGRPSVSESRSSAAALVTDGTFPAAALLGLLTLLLMGP